MTKFFKIMGIGLFLILGLFPLSLSQQEQITITTYYPSPYGSYRELRAQRMAIGDNYFNDNTVCWQDCPGGVTPVDAATDLVVEGSVGIGTRTPAQPPQAGRSMLNVRGYVQVDYAGQGIRIAPFDFGAEIEGIGTAQTLLIRGAGGNEGRVGIGAVSSGPIERPLKVAGNIPGRHTAAFLDTLGGVGVAVGGWSTPEYGSIQAYRDVASYEPRNLILQAGGGFVAIGTTETTRPFFVQARETIEGYHTAAFRAANSYGVAIGGIGSEQFGSIQAFRTAATAPDSLNVDLVLNAGGLGNAVRIGGAFNPTARLDVAGNVVIGGTIRGASYGFGGMYDTDAFGTCLHPNPITNDCSCPAGFTNTLISEFAIIASGGGVEDDPGQLFFCWK